MTTPVQLHFSTTPPRTGRDGDENQLGGGDQPRDQSWREQAAVPDYINLIEDELKAFQQELQRIETALNAHKGLRRDRRE